MALFKFVPFRASRVEPRAGYGTVSVTAEPAAESLPLTSWARTVKL
jgi:hypothetical protein